MVKENQKRVTPEIAKIGLKVVLRSGGPTMTIHILCDQGREVWICGWFLDGEYHQQRFHVDELLLLKKV